jgi:hypothetical protein
MARRQLSHRNEGSATLGPARTRIPQQGLAAAGVAVVAFLSYYRTLLPGLDLGDSASFQTIAGSLNVNPRQAYPLYFALGNLFVWLHPGEPARAVNLASAAYGAIGVGLASWFAGRLSESLLAGVGAGLFLAFSYTFWSQSITAEVYTLHLMMVGAAGMALLGWADRPTPARLALFYVLFAGGFGNHLSMALLLPAFTVFLLMHRRPGAADPLRPRMLIMAVAIAALGALQYAWNFRGLWSELEPPATWAEAMATFWFDVTKADWRETLVMTVSETGLQHRPAMYWFDLRQQFGMPGIGLAAIGFFYVLWRWPARAILLLLLYGVNLAFAWTYNVGDAYIFFLPSHYVVALSAGTGIAAVTALCARVSSRAAAAAVGALILVYPAWRGYDTLPAVDRSSDRRAEQLLDELTTPPRRVSPPGSLENTVFGLDTNWQVQNALEYYMRERKPGIAWFTTEQLEWLQEVDRVRRFRHFVTANAEIGRTVVVTERVLDKVHQPESRTFRDPPSHFLQFSDRVRSVPPGTPYVLAILRSDVEFSLNTTGFAHAWEWLAPRVMAPTLRYYTVVVGRVGDRPVLVESQDRPYRVRTRLEPYDVDVRMESWLPTDTIRRAGFGHVVVNRQHTLTLERGLGFVALGSRDGPVYGSGLFAPVPTRPITSNP